MANKGNLFLLIKLLSKAEKRNFKIYCFNKDKNNNYLQLFEAYDKQSDLDENSIKQKFKGKAFAQQLHVTKNYLYHLILKSLRNQYADLSKDTELQVLLRNIEVLFFKGLYDHCQSEIQKAEKLAIQFEHQIALLQVAGWKRKLHLAHHGATRQKELDDLLKMEANIIQQISKQNQYWQLLVNVFEYHKRGPELLALPLIQSHQENDPLDSQTLHYHILYTNYVINGQSQSGYDSLIKLVELMEQHPHRIKDDPSAFITVLNNLISYKVRFKNPQEVIPLLEKVRSVPIKYAVKNHKKHELKLWLRTYNIELEMYRDARDFEKSNFLIPKIETFIESNKKNIPSEYLLLYWFQFANIYFLQKKHNLALKWTNIIIENRYNGIRKDLERYTRLLNLMVHFDLGNIIVLRYGIESCRRFFKKTSAIQPFENSLLKFFAKISNAPIADYPVLFQQLKNELFHTDQPLVNDDILDYLDFKWWIEQHEKK